MSAGLEICSRSMPRRRYRCLCGRGHAGPRSVRSRVRSEHRSGARSAATSDSASRGDAPAAGGRALSPSKDDAKRAGRQAISGLRGTLAQGVARLLKRDPELLSEMVELGLVRHEWLDDPTAEPVSTATPMEVVQRWLERSVEQRPSVLGKLGLNTIELLSSTTDGAGGEGVPTRLAVAFTDLEGFTAFTAAEGDEAASQLLAAHHKEVGPVI